MSVRAPPVRVLERLTGECCVKALFPEEQAVLSEPTMDGDAPRASEGKEQVTAAW